MGKSSDKQSDSPRGDARLREFLRRAGPILAAERGWNQRSRLKLKSLAEDLRLPRPLYDAAIQRLQEGQLEWDKQLSLYETKFIDYIRRQLSKSKNKVLTGAHEKKAIRIARRQFQIPKHRARQLLRQVADELGMSRVSQTDAINYMENTIVDAVGLSAQIPEDLRERLVAAGHRWGVDRDRVELMIQATLDANRATIKPQGSIWIRAVAGIVSTLLMIAVAYFAYSIVGGGGGSIDTPSLEPPEFIPQSQPKELVIPSWWSESTGTEFARLLDRLPKASVEIGKLAERDPAVRFSAYRQFIEFVVAQKPESFQVLGPLVGLLFHDEFDPTIYTAMLDLIASHLDIPVDQLPNNASSYQAVFAANYLMDQCYQLTDDAEKRSLVEERCRHRLGLAPQKDNTGYRDSSERMIASQQWRHLRSLSYSQPRQASRLIQPLSELTKDKIAEQAQQEFATMMTILSRDPSVWKNLTESLSTFIESGDDGQILEIYQQSSTTPDRSLANWLVQALAQRLNISTDAVPIERVRKQVGEKLQLSAGDSIELGPRWQQLRRQIRRQKSQDSNLPEGASPQQIADAAYYSTLSFLLHQAKWQAKRERDRQHVKASLRSFDQLVLERPRDMSDKLRSEESAKNLIVYGRVKRQPLPSDTRWHDDALVRLEQFEGVKPEIRAVALQRLAESADRFRDIKPNQARSVARYLLHAKETPDIVAIEKYANRLTHWANLAIAIADEISVADVTIDHALTVAQLVADVELISRVDENWRESLSARILTRVAGSLQHTAEIEGDADDYQWNELDDFLFEMYRIRCLAAQIAPAKISGAASPADLAALLANDQRLGNQSARLQRANDLIADNQLQRFVLHGQLLVESTNDEFQTMNLFDGGVIIDEFRSLNRQAKSITQQLLLNELTLMKLWMLSSKN